MSEPVLRVEKLEYSYPAGHGRALCGVDLTVMRGESVALVGPNGSGKSTLVLHLNGILRGSGLVHVAGVQVKRSTLRQIREKVGLVFQDPDDQLFMPTVAEDVAFGPTNLGLDSTEIRSRVEAALADVGLSGFEERAPHHLSEGEKRAVAMATVLAMRPEILVLDEPTAGLDPRGRRRLRKILDSLDVTRFIASHDLEFVLLTCERCLVIDAGRIVADGPTRELLADEALMDRHGLEVPGSLAD